MKLLMWILLWGVEKAMRIANNITLHSLKKRQHLNKEQADFYRRYLLAQAEVICNARKARGAYHG